MKLSALPIPVPDWNEAAEELSADEVAIIFSFLNHVDIMHARVCTLWREAAKKTLVLLTDFDVNSVRSYDAMRVMSTALPNLQQIAIRRLGPEQRYTNGEDPRERIAVATANWNSHDINIVSNFRQLRELKLWEAPLNGRYPVLFDFPLLRFLCIHAPGCLKFDLEMLKRLPSLEELYCTDTRSLTGNLNSLRVLRDTLVKVQIVRSRNIKGNFMDIADFPRLRELNLYDTAVTGDIRDISGSDFPALESICLPKTVAGGSDYEFQRISEVPSFMHAIHFLLHRDIMPLDWTWMFGWKLSRDSPDWYAPNDDNPILLEALLIGVYLPDPPFSLQIIQAGKRLGWSWCSHDGDYSCEINWLDPVPSTESDDYGTYMKELQRFVRRNDFTLYRGYHQPPNEEEYYRLCEEELQH